MQLNGTIAPTMAASSEPPEPPPRNPEKINASLSKQISTDAVSVFKDDLSENRLTVKIY